MRKMCLAFYYIYILFLMDISEDQLNYFTLTNKFTNVFLFMIWLTILSMRTVQSY